jgi:hypothetical protein
MVLAAGFSSGATTWAEATPLIFKTESFSNNILPPIIRAIGSANFVALDFNPAG